jgi:hypothetical protein
MTEKKSRGSKKEATNELAVNAPTSQPSLGNSPANGATRTPLFQAMHAERYQRQFLIQNFQAITHRKLVCYVAGTAALINRDDTLGFVDLLHNIPKGSDLDFLLHTPGGDMDAAEKLITMIRTRVGNGRLRVIVPDFAKSAGTLIAIGADVIAMSDCSELGPIDPQITLNDAHSNSIPHSIQSYLDAYAAHSQALKQDPTDQAARIMLEKLDPGTIKLFEAARERARTFAESQLKRHSPTYTKVAAALLDTHKWLSHGQMIGHEDATSIGLNVEYHDPQSPNWHPIWQLYALQRMAVRDDVKLFESDVVSVQFESGSASHGRSRGE